MASQCSGSSAADWCWPLLLATRYANTSAHVHATPDRTHLNVKAPAHVSPVRSRFLVCVTHTCFWWGKVRFSNINRNRTFKDYYTWFKNTTPKEEKSITRSIRTFDMIWYQNLIPKSRCQLFVAIDRTKRRLSLSHTHCSLIAATRGPTQVPSAHHTQSSKAKLKSELIV